MYRLTPTRTPKGRTVDEFEGRESVPVDGKRRRLTGIGVDAGFVGEVVVAVTPCDSIFEDNAADLAEATVISLLLPRGR